MGARGARRIAGGALAGFLIATAARAAKPVEKPIVAGPSSITAEEAAIQADPAAGIQHGVILVEEAFRDETGGRFVLNYHLRAKILSPEGRKLADIEIPVGSKRSALKSWWARTILPDGRVLNLPETALTEQTVAKHAKTRSIVLKGSLEGVEPGVVIDYGFSVQASGALPVSFVQLEREWPVRKLRYVWKPDAWRMSSYASLHLEGRNAQVVSKEGRIVVTAANLNPVKDEPYSPPKGELRATVILYYGGLGHPRVWWDLEAQSLDAGLTAFSKRPEVQRTVAAMALPEGDAAQRLRAAYEWMETRFVNIDEFSSEEQETNATGEEADTRMKLVVETRRGTPWQLAYIYAAVARAIGAEASLVYTVDRTERFWNVQLPTRAQFDYLFAAVRPSRGAPDAPWTIVQPVAGMPYGELPWPATGSTAFQSSPAGMRTLTLAPAPGPKNRSETRAKLWIDDGVIRGTWSRTALGASGMEPRRELRRAEPSERKELLESLCRNAGGGEVLSASHPDLEEPRAPFKIECDVTGAEANVPEHLDVYAFQVGGAWWPATPELPAAKRVHPVIFDYPREDLVTLDVEAPDGFAPGDVPAAIDTETTFGRYRWTVSKTETGFHVERSFALFPLIVRPPDYEALRAFLTRVHTADRTPLPFRRLPVR